MKILFKNTTKYTKENCNEFIEFHNRKYGKREILKLGLIAIAILYIFISNLIYKNWKLILGIILFGIVLYFIQNNMNIKKEKKRNKVKEYSFYFYEKYIKVKCRKEFERLFYFKLHKIFETDEYFYLYLDEKSSFILRKDGFEIGTPEEFSKFIKEKCPLKYSKEREH